MGIRVELEKFPNTDIPIPEDGVTFGTIAASNVQVLIRYVNTVFSGSFAYPTVTITLKGIVTPPLSKPGLGGTGANFRFRDIDYTVIDVIEGAKLKVGNQFVFLTWTVKGIGVKNGKGLIG